MIEGFSKEAAGVSGIALFGLVFLRWFGLRVSKDAIALKSDASDRASIDSLNRRIEQLDARVNELERSRALALGFVARCMAYISQCDCDDIIPTKEEIQEDYRRLIDDLAGIMPKKEAA